MNDIDDINDDGIKGTLQARKNEENNIVGTNII